MSGLSPEARPASGAARIEPVAEPYTGGAVLRNFSLTLVSRVASMVANFGFVILTARLFPAESVAVLAVCGIATMLMDVCKGLGLGTVLLKRLPQLAPDSPEAALLVRSHLFYSMAPPALLATAGWLGAPLLSRYFLATPDYGHALGLGMLSGLLTVVANSHLLVLQASRQFGQLAAMMTAASVLQRLAPCLVALAFPGPVDRFLLWSSAGAAAAAVVSVVPVAGLAGSRGTAGAWLLRPAEFWPESRHFYFTSLLRYSSTQIDQLFVAAMFPPKTLAVYYLLRRLYSMGVVLIGSMMDALMPDLSQQAGEDRNAARTRLGVWSRVSLYAGTIGAAVMAGHGGLLAELLLGPAYSDDPALITLFAGSAICYFLYGFAQTDLILFHEPRRSLWLAATTAATNLVAGPVASHWFGVHSIPLAMMAGYLIGLMVLRGGSAPDVEAWSVAELLVSLGVIVASGGASMAARWAGADGWVRTSAVSLVILCFSWSHYSRWRVGECLRQLSTPAA